MDENTIYTESNSVKIADEVIQAIAAMAANDVSGVKLCVGLTDGIVEKLVKKNFSKGVRIELNEKEARIELHITVDYGVNIQSIACQLQEAVKRNVETMTDLTVLSVDVCVEGINLTKEPKAIPMAKTEKKAKKSDETEKTEE